MSRTITLSRRFFESSWSRRLYYRLVPARSAEKKMKRLWERGVFDMDLGELETRDRNRILKAIIKKSPGTVLDMLNAQKIQVNCMNFSLADAYTPSKFPLLKFAYANACAFRGQENLSTTTTDIVKSAVQFNMDSVCKSRMHKFLTEVFLRWPFYLGGMVLLDFYLSSQLVSQSDYLLTSKYFDYFEWAAPFSLDLMLGIGVWGAGFKHETFRRLEPYKYAPLPLLGYWAGRFAKKILQFSVQTFYQIPSKTVPVLLSTLAKYFRLRLYDFRKEVKSDTMEASKINPLNWSPQKGLIDRWLKKGLTSKARNLFTSVLDHLIRNNDKRQASYILSSFKNDELELKTFLNLLPTGHLTWLVSSLGEKEALRLFTALPIHKRGRILSSSELERERTQALLREMSMEDAVWIFEKMDLKRAAELLLLLPRYEFMEKPSLKRILNKINEERALSLIKNIVSETDAWTICRYDLEPEFRNKFFKFFLSSEVSEKASKIFFLDILSTEEIVEIFEEVDPKRAAELLPHLPRFELGERPNVSRVLNKMNEEKALGLLGEIESEDFLRDIYVRDLTPELRIKFLEFLPAERAAKFLKSKWNFLQEECVRAAIVGLEVKTKAKILGKLSSQKEKIQFLEAHYEKTEDPFMIPIGQRGVFEILNEYVCEDGLRLLMNFCEPGRVDVERIIREHSAPESIKEFSEEDIRKYASILQVLMNGISIDNFFRFLGFLNENELRECLLINYSFLSLYILSWEILNPQKLTPLIQDLLENRLPADLEKEIMHRSVEFLCEIIKRLPYHLKLNFFDRLPTDKKRFIFSNLVDLLD